MKKIVSLSVVLGGAAAALSLTACDDAMTESVDDEEDVAGIEIDADFVEELLGGEEANEFRGPPSCMHVHPSTGSRFSGDIWSWHALSGGFTPSRTGNYLVAVSTTGLNHDRPAMNIKVGGATIGSYATVASMTPPGGGASDFAIWGSFSASMGAYRPLLLETEFADFADPHILGVGGTVELQVVVYDTSNWSRACVSYLEYTSM